MQVPLEASLNGLDFWNKPRSRKVTMINSIFSWPLHPRLILGKTRRVVMLALVRARTLEKGWPQKD